MLAHSFGEAPHAYAGEVVDCETGVARIGVVHGEDAFEAGLEDVVFEAGLQAAHAHCFGKVLKEDFDEDTAARGCFFFVKMNDRKDMPADRVRAYEVAKKAGDVAKAIGFVAMDCIIVVRECVFE